MIPLLIFPVTSFSIILYLFLIIFGNNIAVYFLGFIFSFILNLFAFKKKWLKIPALKLEKSFLIFLLIILVYVLAKGFVLSPVVLTIKQDNFEHIQITDIGDYYKHILVANAIAQDGIPPLNPYYPEAKLSYYYGYYLIPAFLIKVLNIAPNWAMYSYGLFITGLSLLIFLRIIYEQFKRFYLRLTTFLLIIFGSGIDIFAYLFSNLGIFKSQLTQVLVQGSETGIQLINFYKSVIFVPQHFFVAVVTAASTYYLIKYKKDFIFLGFSFAFVFISSTVVFPTLVIWLILSFIFFKDLRILLFKSVLLAGILALPYILILRDRSNVVYFYQFVPYTFSGNIVIDTLLSALICYGPMLLLAFPILFFSKISLRKNLFYILLVLIPVCLTWFIRSPLFNDYSLRTLMPVAMILPILFLKIYEFTKNAQIKYLIIFVSVLTIIAGAGGFYFEYLSHWKTRQILNPRDSEVLLKLRQLPDVRLAAVDRERWVEFIPSIAYKKVLTPHLFDTYNYISGDAGYSHADYENLANRLFINQNSASNLQDLIILENSNLKQLPDFFAKNFDKLILKNQVWLKKDQNPWVEMLKEMGVKNEPLTSNFTLFDAGDLKQKLSENRLYLDDQVQTLEIKDGHAAIPKGFFYIAACGKGQLKLGFEDYYDLFNVESPQEKCTGKMFYLENSEDVKVSGSSTVDEIYIYKILITSGTH